MTKALRAAAAWVCMLAVVLLYAPLAGAALLAHGMDCCTDGLCKIPAHHHGKLAAEQPMAGHSADCDHESGGIGMTPCKMSCCQDSSRPAVMPVAFVLPTVSVAPALNGAVHAAQMVAAVEISRFERPLAPPPRFSSSLL